MAHLLSMADHSSQWFMPAYPGAEMFSHLEKFVGHTTETEGWPGYDGGAKAPNATYHPRLHKVRQHFYSDRSSRALRDPTETPVRENRDNVFQLEIVAYSDKALAASVGGLWIGDLTADHYVELADILHELHEDLALPLVTSVRWNEGAATQSAAQSGITRLTSSGYDAYRGILGHIHVPGQTHWDPGGFRMSHLLNALGVDMALSKEDAKTVWATDEIINPPDSETTATNPLWAPKSAVERLLQKAVAHDKALADLKVAVAKPQAVTLTPEQFDTLSGLIVTKLMASAELGFRPND